MIQRIKNKLKYLFSKHIHPEIIGGWKNENVFYSKTGISNMCHISQKDKNLHIGDNVFIGHFNYIDGKNAKLSISNGVQITNYCSILTHSSHNAVRFGNAETIKTIGEVFIGENSFIGAHSVIMPNTYIGKGCIISAYSYVQGSFPDYAILRGQPARIIGDTRQIDKKILEKYPDLQNTYYLHETH